MKVKAILAALCAALAIGGSIFCMAGCSGNQSAAEQAREAREGLEGVKQFTNAAREEIDHTQAFLESLK